MKVFVFLLFFSKLLLSEPHIEIYTSTGRKISHPVIESTTIMPTIKYLVSRTNRPGFIDSHKLKFLTLKHPSDFLPNMASIEFEFHGSNIQKINTTIIDNKMLPLKNTKHEKIWDGYFQKYNLELHPKYQPTTDELYSLLKSQEIEIIIPSTNRDVNIYLRIPNCMEKTNYTFNGECILGNGKSFTYEASSH